MITVRNLSAFYESNSGRTHVLGPIDFDIQEGEFVSLVGPSGCGKSTLAKIFIGMHKNYSGELHLDDSLIKISTVFQDYGVFPWKTAIENIAFVLREQGNSKKASKEIAFEWLKKVRLENFAEYYPAELSGGMKQRLSIARALSIQPDLLILDEPFRAIDTQLRERLQEELSSLLNESNTTTIQITHDYDEAILLSNRIFVLSESPATIRKELQVNLPAVRNIQQRETETFIGLRKTLRDEIRAGDKLK